MVAGLESFIADLPGNTWGPGQGKASEGMVCCFVWDEVIPPLCRAVCFPAADV